MFFRSSHNYKTNGATPIRVGPQGPSQIIVEVLLKFFDVACSFVYAFISINMKSNLSTSKLGECPHCSPLGKPSGLQVGINPPKDRKESNEGGRERERE